MFLSVATFFEGYDFIALTQVLPNLGADFGLSETALGVLVAFINAGTVAAYLLVRLADRWGRRQVLTITIAGSTVFTAMSGLAPEVYSFAVCQFVARMFLIGEWATSMVYAAEEFPAARRGMVIGTISAFSSLGSVVCAGLVPFLLASPYGWRTVYFVGIIPLILLAVARRSLRESTRFAAQVDRETRRPFTYLLGTPYRKRMFQMAAIWATIYICTHNTVTFWKNFAVKERGLTDGDVGGAITIAAIVAMPLVFLVGPMIDRFGRKRGAAIVFVFTAVGVFGAYTLHDKWALTGSLVLAIFGASAVLPVLNAFTTELFPTDLRGDAFAWSNNLLGRIGYVASPVALGAIAERIGWGPTVSTTAIAPIVALALIYWLLPETRGRELEQTAALD